MDPIGEISRGVEGGMMQLNMDTVPVAYGAGVPTGEGGAVIVGAGGSRTKDGGGGANDGTALVLGLAAVSGGLPPTDAGAVQGTAGAGAAAPDGDPGLAAAAAAKGGTMMDPNAAAAVTGAVGVEEGRGGAQVSRRDAAINPFQAMRVPCPRLCGASFGVGGGGIVTFHNGEVRKMWSWFRSDLELRSGRGVAGAPGAPPPRGAALQGGATGGASGERGGGGGGRVGDLPAGRDAPSRRMEDGEPDDAARPSLPANAASATAADQNSPRTMLDLMRMNAAAKIAQWGEDIDGDSSDDGDDGGRGDTDSSSSDSDDSYGEADESNSSASEDDLLQGSGHSFRMSSYGGHHRRTTSGDLYDEYFRDLQKPVAAASLTAAALGKERSSGSGGGGPASRKSSGNSRKVGGGPSVDPLGPVVSFTRRYDDIVLNGQCPELANGWQLGAWWLTDDGEDPLAFASEVYEDESSSTSPEESKLGGSLDDRGLGRVDESVRVTGGPEPYRHIFPNVPRETSQVADAAPTSPQLNLKSLATLEQATSGNTKKSKKSFHEPIEEYDGRRSQRQQTMMGNFHKLLVQNPGSLSMTPLDAPMMQKSLSSSSMARRSASLDAILQKLGPHVSMDHRPDPRICPRDGSTVQRRIGVYTVATTTHKDHMSSLAMKQMLQTRNICLHNASICIKQDQAAKADVWSLLAQVVDNVANSELDDFDGWGGAGRGALGRDLVENVLNYYETQGDVQMLATIVCVLSGGRDRRKAKNFGYHKAEEQSSPPSILSGLRSLLPANDDKYDAYIRRYGALLYSWGQLTIRSELHKHLAYTLPGAGGEQLIPVSDHALVERFISNHGVAPGISFAPRCPRCNRPTRPETNICDWCRDYAFRCSICTNAVRGLFTVCMACGHGGHVEHIMPWFSSSNVCPSGCGCACILNTFIPHDEKMQTDSRAFFAKASRRAMGNAARPLSGTSPAMPQFGGMEEIISGPGALPFGAYAAPPRKSGRSNDVGRTELTSSLHRRENVRRGLSKHQRRSSIN